MLIGLLLCDHVAPEVIHSVSGDYDRLFADLLGAVDPAHRFESVDVIGGDLPSDPTSVDAWLLTGSRHSVTDDADWIIDLAAWVAETHRAARVPMMGICFGHQMLAHALGGVVQRHEGGWGVGIRSLELAGPSVAPGADRFDLIHLHQDQVTTLPPAARRVGSSAHCLNAAIEFGTGVDRASVGKTASAGETTSAGETASAGETTGGMASVITGSSIGVQAHPEFTVDYARAILESRRERIGGTVADEALATLDERVDEGLGVARWLCDHVAAAGALRRRS